MTLPNGMTLLTHGHVLRNSPEHSGNVGVAASIERYEFLPNDEFEVRRSEPGDVLRIFTIDLGPAVHPEGSANPQEAPKHVNLTKLNLETLEVFFPSENPSSVIIWFDKSTIESLRKIANRQDLPVGWLIRKVMKEFIDREGR